MKALPRKVREKLGEIHRVRTEKTFWDELGEFIGGLIMVAVIIGILVAIF